MYVMCVFLLHCTNCILAFIPRHLPLTTLHTHSDAAALNIIRFLVLFIGCLSCAKGSPGLISCMRSISDISLVLMFGKLLAISWGALGLGLGVGVGVGVG